VVEHWISEHAEGLTPNPCIRCNGSVRLDAMLELADRLGAGTLATGHYARTDGRRTLRMAADVGKDQSYVLCALAPESLERMRFPLGGLQKRQVRELAREAGLEVAGRRDSQDLCFLAGTGREAFLERHGGLARRTGAIVREDGERLGEHPGAHLFTTGQRRGLGLSGGDPMYVLRTDAASNTVTVGPRTALLAGELRLSGLVLRRAGAAIDSVRLRAHGRQLPCRLPEELPDGRHAGARVELAAPAERTAPGQLACLYAGEMVAGHGAIAA
jgi:tRNA-specific 2-thiouridylase